MLDAKKLQEIADDPSASKSSTCESGECVCVAPDGNTTNKQVPITFWRGQAGHDSACQGKTIGESCSSMWQTGTCARIDGRDFLVFEGRGRYIQ